MATIDKDMVLEAYNDVRNDMTPTTWALLSYNQNNIMLNSTGEEYMDLLQKITEDERLFAFVRFTSGDELSKRAKFVLITWVGSDVTPLKRAKVSTDKTLVKSIMKSFALEIQTSELADLEESQVRMAVQKAGGANYGTGSRDVEM